MGGGSGGGLFSSATKRLEEQAKQKRSEAKQAASRHVFISVDHEDLDEVNILRGQAKDDKVDVVCDENSLEAPFDRVKPDFIKRQIRGKIDRGSVAVGVSRKRPLRANG
ncbi:MAG: hypothetical protein POG24_07405 [Acidocella sp.]|nr:hypothetical protein [Acidocella sp.]